MKLTEISVRYGLRLSTGNYGSEAVEVEAVAELGDDDIAADVVAQLMDWCKLHATEQLAQSDFEQVRRTLERAKAPAPDALPEDDYDDRPF